MSRISLSSVGNQLQVSRGNTLSNSFIISHLGLSMFSLPLEIGTLLSFNLLILESPFQKIQKLYNNIHLRFCSSGITFVIKIQLKLEMLRPGFGTTQIRAKTVLTCENVSSSMRRAYSHFLKCVTETDTPRTISLF